MELSEVANVQFAVPVIGVVVCAVLVFAFGFKSPGQPPSFDALIDDDRKAKRNRNRRSGVAHSEKHKNIAAVAAGQSGVDDDVDDDNEGTNQNRAIKSTIDGSKHQSSASIVRAAVGTSAEVADKAKVKSVKADEQSSVITPREDKVTVVGEWTTAVSKKDKKNRGRKDDNAKQDKLVINQNDHLKQSFVSSSRDSSKQVKHNKKISELTTVTVIVPGLPTSSNSTTETSTRITETAVIKVKVVPSARVSVSTHQTPNGHAVMDRKSTPRQQPLSGGGVAPSVRGLSTVAPWAKLDSDTSAAGSSH